MRTALDTNVLSRLWSSSASGPELTRLMRRWRAAGGMVISGAVYAELLAYPGMSRTTQDAFLAEAEIAVDAGMNLEAWAAAGVAYAAYEERRRQSRGGLARRLLADFVIGAHAQLHADRLATLDPSRYRRSFPDLVLIP